MTTTTTERKGLEIWHDPTASYGWGLGPVGAIAAFISVLCCFAALIPAENKIRNFLVVAVLSALVVGPFAIRDKWGRNIYARVNAETRWIWHRVSGQNYYEAAWFSTSSVTKSRLPGLLSQLSVGEQPTEDGQSTFAVLHHPSAKTVGVVIECRPFGDDLADEDVTSTQKNTWANWLSAIADEPRLAGVQIVSEAAPSNRQHVLQAVSEFRTGQNDLTDQIMTEMVDKCSGGNATREWVTVSWKTKSRTDDDFTTNVFPARIERLCLELAEAGGGHCAPLSKDELSRLWTEMYHPDRREVLAEYPESVVDISEVGPTTHQEQRDRYVLDRHDAVSLTVGQAPEGEVTTAIYDRLSKGIQGTVAVRWSQLLRPVAPVEARSWTTSIERAIETRMALRGDRKEKISDVVADEDTTATSKALARGAKLTRAGFSITLTVDADADISTPIERTINACAPLSPHLRVMDGVHQTSWIATLPGAMPIPETVDLSGGLNR